MNPCIALKGLKKSKTQKSPKGDQKEAGQSKQFEDMLKRYQAIGRLTQK